jgi:Fe-S-cluster containining protein
VAVVYCCLYCGRACATAGAFWFVGYLPNMEGLK